MSASGRQARPSLEIIEEAVHLLRTAPAAALASYYAGTLPFVLGVLYFWADMSRSAFAEQHLAGSALTLAALFLCMKSCQAIFAGYVRAVLAGAPAPPLTFRRVGRIAMTQTALQPSGLVVLPVALVLTLPFGWTYAFYQNLTALADGNSAELRPLVKTSLRQAALWPRENHALLGIMSGFALCVLLNWASVLYLLPLLAKTLFGVETVFSRSGLALLNTTFFAAVFGLAYLCVDPILKAAYVLRCFYGDSLQSGEDLKAELRHLAGPMPKIAAAALLLAAGVMSAHAVSRSPQPVPQASSLRYAAAESTPQPPGSTRAGAPPISATEHRSPAPSPKAVSPPELDRTIREVIQQPKYAWRLPRERAASPDSQSGVTDRFLQRAGKFLREKLEAFSNWLGNWLRKLFSGRRQTAPGSSGYGWILTQELLIGLLVLLVLGALGFLIYRVWRDRPAPPVVVTGEAIQPAPDLADENIGPEQLPEDGWLKLARELLARGELRLALRAFYLSSLASLAERNLLSLARFKSNRDYERELHRRAHPFPELLACFGQNVTMFDQAWYGLHPVDGEAVNQFALNVEKIRGEPSRAGT